MNLLKSVVLLLTFLFLIAVPGNASSQGLVGNVYFDEVTTQAHWDAVRNHSKETGRPVFVVVVAEWCRYCRLLESTVFTDIQVSEYLNMYFDNYKMDGEKDYGKTFAALHGVKGFPAIFFFNSDGSILQTVNGYVEPALMLSYARKALRRSDLIPILESRYREKIITSMEMITYLDYIESLDRSKAISIANDYLEEQGEGAFRDSVMYLIVWKYALDAGRRTPLEVVQNKDEFISLYGRESFDNYFAEMFTYNLEAAIYKQDENMVTQLLPLLKLHFPDDTDGVAMLGAWKIFYAETDNPGGYDSLVSISLGSMTDTIEFLLEEAYDIAMNYADYQGFPELADRWLDIVSELMSPDFDVLYLHAYVKLLTGQIAEAEELIQSASRLASNKEEKELVQQLLQYIGSVKE